MTEGHSGVKGSRVVWLGDRDRIATTGVSPGDQCYNLTDDQFSKMSDRQLGLWDTSGLKNLEMNSLDSSA